MTKHDYWLFVSCISVVLCKRNFDICIVFLSYFLFDYVFSFFSIRILFCSLFHCSYLLVVIMSFNDHIMCLYFFLAVCEDKEVGAQ